VNYPFKLPTLKKCICFAHTSLTIALFCLHIHNPLIQIIALLVLTVLSHFPNPCNDFHPLLHGNKSHTCTYILPSSKKRASTTAHPSGCNCHDSLPVKLSAFTVECHDNHSMIVFIFHDSWVQLFPSEIFSTVLTTDVRQLFFSCC